MNTDQQARHPQEVLLVEGDGVTLTSEGLKLYSSIHRDAAKRDAFTEQSIRQAVYKEVPRG